MGISELWEALAPAAHTRTLTQFAVFEGFEQRRRPGRCLRIAIDASIWMNQAQITAQRRRGKGTRAGENPAVRILFYRLCRLLTLPIVPIVVFDGPKRPSKKRGVAVKTVRSHWLTLPFQRFIEAFGFSWYTAPGEAEADLAELSRREAVDAIMSEDSDVMVFGARCVIRMLNVRDVGDQVNIFDARSIQDHPEVLFDHAALFIMAILCGGDYHKAGLRGCGSKIASLVARTEVARSLFTAATSLPSRGALNAFLGEWRQSFRTLLAQDPDNVLGHKYRSLAANVTDEFPSVDVVLLYAQPITSWTSNRPPDEAEWCPRQPRLAEIGELCEKYFSWGSSGEIVGLCKDTLWPGVAIRYLLEKQSPNYHHEALVRYANDTKDESTSITTLHIPRVSLARLGPGASSTHPDVSGYTIQAFTHEILRKNISKLDATTQSLLLKTNDAPSKSTVSFWLPGSILEAAVPDVVQRYRGKRPTAPTYLPILSPYAAATAGLNINADDDDDDSDGVEIIEAISPVRSPDFESIEQAALRIGTPDIEFPSRIHSPDIEFIEGPSRIRTPHICSPDVEFIEGSSTSNRSAPTPKFLGYFDLCTPSPSP